jgi:ADP-ribose pyrophosphatase
LIILKRLIVLTSIDVSGLANCCELRVTRIEIKNALISFNSQRATRNTQLLDSTTSVRQGKEGKLPILKKEPLHSKNDYPNHPRLAVGAVVFKDEHVLLVRRGQPPAEGLWAIPGGSVKIGETLQAAAEREIREETGIRIRAAEPIYTFDVIERDKTGSIRFHYVIVDLSAEYVSGELTAGDDAIDARWISADEINSLAVSSTTLQLLKDKFDFGSNI